MLTDEDRAFRDGLRAQVRAAVPERLRAKLRRDLELTREDFVESHKALHGLGLAVPHWPEAWGGRGWTGMRRHLWQEALQIEAVPPSPPFNTDMIGPVLIAFGTDAQKARYLADTAALDIWWCQGFSEPNAGSDLASLTTRARAGEKGFVIDGQKTWTSYAQHATHMFGLFRTDPEAPKKQLGISFLIFPMDLPGIEVRPIRTADGRQEVNEVFFDGVEVGPEALVGQLHRGWDVAKFLLANERHHIAGLGWVKMRLNLIHQLAQERGAWDDALFRRRFAEIEAECIAVDKLQLMALSGEAAGEFGGEATAANVLKIRGSELQQATTELLLDLVGVGDPAAASGYMTWRKVSIYGGSNEIQHEILAKALLG